MKQSTLQFGFTLIELMITVAIVGLLAGIAYPSYMENVQRARRADAKAVLQEGAQYMERIYTERGAYNVNSEGVAQTTLTGIVFPTNLTKSPKDGATKYYDIDLSGTITASGFTLAATPRNPTDKCGPLTLTNTGAKGFTAPTGSTASLDDCWNR